MDQFAQDPTLLNAKTVQEIGMHLQNKYGIDVDEFINSKFDGRIEGTTPKELSVESARQFALAVDYVKQKYPFVELERIRADYAKREGFEAKANASAKPKSVKDPEAPRGVRVVGHDSVTIGYNLATDEDRVAAGAGYVTGQRNRARTSEHAFENVVYYSIIHEMGHALDNTGQRKSWERIEQELYWAFEESPEFAAFDPSKYPNPDTAEKKEREVFNRWLADKLVSNYSYQGGKRGNEINMVEAIADAFLDVEIRGMNSEELSRLIHRILIEEAKKAKGVA